MTRTPAEYSQSNQLSLVLSKRLKETKQIPPGIMDCSSSVLHDFCARESALAFLKGIVREKRFGSDLIFIFKDGQAHHDTLQNYLLGPLGLIFGRWLCLNCAKLHGSYTKPKGRIRMPDKCSACGIPREHERETMFRYKEDELLDAATGFVAHPDGYDEESNIYEFKSISLYSYQGRPKPEHLVQTQANLHMQRLVRNNDSARARLVYWQKGATSIMDALHEFHIPYNEKIARKYFQPAVHLAQFRRNGKLPPRVCDSPKDLRAARCALKSVCFEEGKQ